MKITNIDLVKSYSQIYDNPKELKAAFAKLNLPIDNGQQVAAKIANLVNGIEIGTTEQELHNYLNKSHPAYQEHYKNRTRVEFTDLIEQYPKASEIIWPEHNQNILDHWRKLYLEAADKHDCLLYVLPYQ